MNDQASLAHGAVSTHRRRRWRAVVILLGSLLSVVAGGAWANHQRYIVITSVACLDQGYRGPVPSFEHLATHRSASLRTARGGCEEKQGGKRRSWDALCRAT
jgi:hypothetical protein